MTTAEVLNKSEIVDLCDVRDGELVLHASMPARYEEWIESHEQAVRDEIAKRYTLAGFIRRLSKIHLLQLQAAETISLDLETTALTPHSRPVSITKQTKFGTLSRDPYLAAHPGVAVTDTTPRMRVMALRLAGKELNLVFDLDLMPPNERQQLIDTVLDGKILIGHNIFGFDLYWLFHESRKRPRAVLDTLLLVRQCMPEILSYANFDAAKGSLERLAEIEEDRDVSLVASASLEAISIALGLPRPDKTWQKPQNWVLSELSAQHLTYVLGDIDTPCRILEHIFGTADGTVVSQTINREYRWYKSYHKAALRTTEATVRGIPFDNEGAENLKGELTAEIAALVDGCEGPLCRQCTDGGKCAAKTNCLEYMSGLKHWSELNNPEILAELRDPSKGTTKKIREAIMAIAKAANVELPLTTTGKKRLQAYEKQKAEDVNLPAMEEVPVSLSKEALLLANINLSALNVFVKLTERKKMYELVEDWQFFARIDGKLHPLYAWTTATGRACSSEPNPLAAPRDKRLRGLLCRVPGWSVILADYSAIELRIAVANAEKAIEEVRSILVNYNHRTYRDYFNGSQAWFLRECYLAKQFGATDYPSDLPPEGFSKEEWQKEKAAHIVRHFASHVFDKEVQSLTAVFKAGVDPHLATALTVLRLRGTFHFPGTATEYLASLSLEEQEQLKVKFKTARQEAKAVNFGLLYGMQAAGLHRYGIVSYGLKWTLKEAEEAYRMWFVLYPEIGFYHCFVNYMCSTKIQPEDVKLWDKYNQGYKAKTYPAKRFRVTSLAGRPFDILDEKNDALSYPGQGSGADLTVRAIASLPQDLADCLTLVIHDEIGLHMPPNAPDGALVALEQVMNKAGDDLLGDYCKCATEGKVHDRWSK